MLRPSSVLGVIFITFGAAACGGGGNAAKPATADNVATKSDDPLEGASVYDEVGKTHKCETPKNSCPGAKDPPREFMDQCALEGFRIIQCGCEQYCTGNAMAEHLHYDANNVGKLCDKAKEDCEPPETSAAFQDACTAARGKFVVCGCEWRCTAKLKGAVPAKPPAEEEPAPAPMDTAKEEADKKPGSAAKKK